jgi:hypothetical protein
MKTSITIGAVAFAAAIGVADSALAATYNLNVSCGVSTCSSVGPFGTVEITGSGNTLTYTFDLTSPSQIDESSITDVFFKVTGNVTGFNVAGVGSGNSAGDFVGTPFVFGWTYRVGSGTVNAGNLDSGLPAASMFNQGFDCFSLLSNECGGDFSVTFTGSGLAAASVTKNGFTMFAGAAVDCANPCTDGPVGAASVASAPGPIAGAGLPGIVIACGGLLALARRRKTSATAA